MKLATTTSDFRDYTASSAEAVKAFAGTGFKHLDYSFYRSNKPGSVFMSDNWKSEIAPAAEEAAKLGFDFVQAHSPSNDIFRHDRETVINGNIRAIEACAFLGIKKLVVHSGRSKELFKPDDWEYYKNEVKSLYEALYPAMEKHGVFVLAENYNLPKDENLCSLNRASDLLEILELCNHPLMGVCWDVGHANLIHPDQYEDIMLLGDKLKAVHMQDNLGKDDDHICPLMGTLDLDGVMKGLIDNGFLKRGGVFTFECGNILRLPERKRNISGEILANMPTIEMKKQAIALMYHIGKTTLEKYNCFEE